MSEEPKRRVSGAIVAQQYRQKYESVTENTIPLLDNTIDRIDRALEKARKSTPPEREATRLPIIRQDSVPDEEEATPDTLPCRDPRREPESDPRREDEIPADEIRLPPLSRKGTP